MLKSRNGLIAQLDTVEKWDIIIVGGGATGLGAVLDAATRGYKTLLVEQADFAKGTSSKATKLVHGGVRYMAQGDIALVREACHERGLLLKNAPHLTKNESFVIPNYSLFNNIKYTIGLKFYDLLAGKLSLGKSKYINKEKTIAALPTIKKEGLKGGVVYHDGQFDDARLALNIAQTAIENGACVLNYMQVTGLMKENDKISGVKLKDAETGKHYEAKGSIVINATGVYVDNILQMDNPQSRHTVRPSQGTHIVIDQSFLPGGQALMIPKTDDGRVLFGVPWHGKLVVGTTDTLREHPELEPRALEEEIDFILNTAGNYLVRKPLRKDILAVFVGLRPLAAPKNENESTKEISRSHKITVTNSNLVTITGGKWTTYRRMAEDVINKAIEVGQLPLQQCVTETLKIHGYSLENKLDEHGVTGFYGTDLKEIESLYSTDADLSHRIVADYPFTKGMVVWSARNEYTLHVEDVLARRFRLLFLDVNAALAAAPTVAILLAKELGKDDVWIEKEIADFTALAKIYTVSAAKQ